MIVTRTFSRFRKISRDRFPCDASIRHNDMYTERTTEIANNTIKKNSATKLLFDFIRAYTDTTANKNNKIDAI